MSFTGTKKTLRISRGLGMAGFSYWTKVNCGLRSALVH